MQFFESGASLMFIGWIALIAIGLYVLVRVARSHSRRAAHDARESGYVMSPDARELADREAREHGTGRPPDARDHDPRIPDEREAEPWERDAEGRYVVPADSLRPTRARESQDRPPG